MGNFPSTTSNEQAIIFGIPVRRLSPNSYCEPVYTQAGPIFGLSPRIKGPFPISRPLGGRSVSRVILSLTL